MFIILYIKGKNQGIRSRRSSISPGPNIHSDTLHKFPKAADPNKLSKHSACLQTTVNADCIVDETREASVCVAKSWSCFLASASTNIERTKPISSSPLKRVVCQSGPKELPHHHTIGL